MTWETPDVLVIGGGTAAAIAALEASKYGKVMMVAKDRIIGGATIQASGGVCIPGIAGEDPELFVQDTLKAGQGINNRELVSYLARNGLSYIEYLQGLGMVFDRDAQGRYRLQRKTEGHSVKHNYQDRRMYHETARVLRANLVHAGVHCLQHAMIFGLCSDGDRVIGAIGYSILDGRLTYIAPRAVVLATGGYGQLYKITDNAASLTGEGHSMALDCGAELVDMEMVQLIPLAFPYPQSMLGVFIGMCSLFGPCVKLLNRHGDRFMKNYAPEKLEFATRDEVSRAIFMEIAAGRGTDRNAVIVDPTENDRSLLPQYRASSPLVYSLISRVFGEKAASWEAPFEAVPSQHFCAGGIRINIEGRTVCKNLFAAGEVTGGVHGANRLGGNALLEVVIMGKAAGEQAALEAARYRPAGHEELRLKEYFVDQEKQLETLFSNNGVSGREVKQEIQEVMWECAGIVRSGRSLEEGTRRIKELSSRAERLVARADGTWNYSVVEALEAKHMLRVAEAVLISALARKESRGTHFREDYPASDAAFLGNVVVAADRAGNMVQSFRPADDNRDPCSGV